MNHLNLRRCALSVSASLSMLAGCGSGAPSPSVPGPTGFSAYEPGALFGLPSTVVKPGSVNPDRGASWIAPEARSRPVLFISDAGTGDVYILKLATLKLVGTITGLSYPYGLCSDTKGNVWVTDLKAQRIYEYSHVGVLENTLKDGYGFPIGCAWDQTTGNLAVMNNAAVSNTAGSVVVYAHAASGSVSLYTNPSQFYYEFGGYDTKGNLFFDGQSNSLTFILSELPKGAKKPQTIEIIGGKIYFPGLVEWDATSDELAVGDQFCGNAEASCIYSLSLSIAHKAGSIKHKTNLKNYVGGLIMDLVQGVIHNGTLYGSDVSGYTSVPTGVTYEWAFPVGRNPTVYNSVAPHPLGAAISK